MARQIGPDQAERVFFITAGSKKGTIVPAGTPVPLYADVQCTLPADVLGLDGSTIPSTIPTVLVGDTLEVPQFQFPDVDDPVVYTRILGGPVVALHPSTDARVDALRAAVATAQEAADDAAANAADRTLSNLSNASAARTALGLGTAATRGVGTSEGTVAAGDDSRIVGAAQKASNLSDVASAVAALANIGGAPRAVSPRESYRVLNERRPTLLIDKMFPNTFVDHQLVYVDDTIMYAVGHDSSLRSSTDRGNSWSRKLAYPGGLGQWAKAGMFLKTSAGSLITTYHPYDLTAPKIQRSTNGGTTWTDVVAAQTNVDYLGPTSVCQDPVTGYIYLSEYVTVSSGTVATWKISRSTDDGATWSTFHTFNRAGAGAVRHGHGIQWDPVGQRIYFVCGDSEADAGIYRVNDAGTDVEPVIIRSQVASDIWPGAVGLMFFPNYIAWGIDQRSDGYLVRVARTQLGQASPVIEKIAQLQSTAFYCVRVAADGSEWLMTVSNEPGGGGRLDNACHVYRVADDGATIDEVLSIPVNSPTSFFWLSPVSTPLQSNTNGLVWLNCNVSTGGALDPQVQGFQFGARLGWGMVPMVKPDGQTRPFYAPATQSSGQVSLAASQVWVFGSEYVPVRAKRLYIIDMGVTRLSGTGLPYVEVYNSTTSALLKLAGTATNMQFQNHSMRGPFNEESAPYVFTTDVLTPGHILHFRISEQVAATCTAVGRITYAWGF